MTTTIIICITLVIITLTICCTVYSLNNNSKLEELYKEIKQLEKSVTSNNEYFYKHWDAVNDYKVTIKELTDLIKENYLNSEKNSEP